jgi:hypothetical protein
MKEVIMANAEPQKLRIVAFRDGDAWVAQCLEYDISAQAPDLQILVRRMNDVIEAEAAFTLEKRGERFAGIDPAPDFFEALFQNVHAEASLKSEMDFRIAA